jgi:hypothetical protein
MATYRPSFVDVSGLTQGITRGLEMATMEKKRQDALAEQSVDEYLKNYRPDKLRDNDIGAFTGAFNDYKQAALRYSRMNRGGAKPEEIALAKSMMDKSLGNLNNLYTNSASSANKLAEYADYIKKARMSGLDIPKDVTDNYGMLLSTSIDKIDANKIPSVYDFELIKKEPDYKKLETIFQATGANASTSETETPYELGKIGKTPITGVIRSTIQARPIDKTIQAIDLAMQTDNALKRDANQLYALFQKNPDTYLKDLQKSIPGVTKDNVTPSMIYGMQYFMPKLIDRKRDDSGAKYQQAAALYASNESYRNRMLALRDAEIRARQQNASQGKRGQIDPVKHLEDFENSIKGTQKFKNALKAKNDQYIPVPDVKGFSGLSKFKFADAGVERIWYFPKTNEYLLKTNVPSDKGTRLSPKELRDILVRGTQGATNKPYEVGDILPTQDELDEAGYVPNKEMMDLLQNLDFGGGE